MLWVCQGSSLDLLVLLWRTSVLVMREGEEWEKGCGRRIARRKLEFKIVNEHLIK